MRNSVEVLVYIIMALGLFFIVTACGGLIGVVLGLFR